MLSLFASSGMVHEMLKPRDSTASTARPMGSLGYWVVIESTTSASLHSDGPRELLARERNTYVVPSWRLLTVYVMALASITALPWWTSCSS